MGGTGGKYCESHIRRKNAWNCGKWSIRSVQGWALILLQFFSIKDKYNLMNVSNHFMKKTIFDYDDDD